MSSVSLSPKQEVLSRPDGGLVAGLLYRPLILGLLLAVATVAVYYPVHRHPFINYDDNDYVYQNPQVQAGLTWHTVRWAFTTSYAANWHPLTWLSHELDSTLFGLGPAGPHDVNLLLHVLNAVLLFWVLLRATGYAGRSFMVAALFALHPVNVESVAWIAERKNMLSMLFFLLALGAYRWYARQPRVRRYAVVVSMFALGLMAKPQIITLPCIVLLWDYWPLQRMFPNWRVSPAVAQPAGSCPERGFGWLLLEKVPLLLIAAASAVMTMRAQHNARVWFERPARVGNAVLSYARYVGKALWPANLAPMYPHPDKSLNWWLVGLAAAVLLAITALVIVGRRRRYLTVGWCWFLGSLVPMLGIVQVGVQAMADRYAYVSFIGLFLMICWGVADWAESRRIPARLLPAISCLALLALALTAHHQLGYWRDEISIWTHTLQVTPPNWVAEDELGNELAKRARVPEAMPHLYRACAMQPQDSGCNLGIGIYNLHHGNFKEAIEHFKIVIKDDKEKPFVRIQSYKDMAKAYLELGDIPHSQECLDAATKLGGS